MTDKIKFAKIAVITDKAILNTKIASIKGRGKRLDADVHKAAVSGLYHAMQHGDSGAVGALRMALPASGNRKKLDMWIMSHAPYKTDDNGKLVTNEAGVPILKKSRTAEDFKLEDSATTPYWDFKPETTTVAWSLEVVRTKMDKQLQVKVDKEEITPAQKTAVMIGLTNAIEMAAGDKPASSEKLAELVAIAA